MINQPNDLSGCGVACVANIIGYSYKEALFEMDKMKCILSNRNITIHQMKKFFLHGKNNVYLKEVSSISEVKNSALLYVLWHSDKRKKHWILYDNKKYYDPNPYEKIALDKYHTEPAKNIFMICSDIDLTKNISLNLTK